ncbi:PDZ domain-containing protein [Egibacter rhizosphaerae]|uniref:PDZ domain-containing protein n=1 Tax=Egibacter rhizosphaerae TaxID=1670831 RepID=A0A411YCK9_9ACTN|nr:trypsin-like peptidase domain-containing protein [Egibacter rhizosphaerae]QBI18905.1 PDZ domain-containing protein [Egibacter rhizosphaerae]
MSAIVAAIVAAVVAAGVVENADVDSAASPAGEDTADADEVPTPDLSGLEADTSVEVVAEATMPSVAHLETGQGATGSAVIFREDGYLITNAHVVGNANQVQVTLGDGQARSGEVVATAPFADIAVLRVDEDGLPTAEFTDEAPNVGAPAIAIGSPFGFDATVTSGVVSALNRTLPADQRGEVVLSDLIQTDAAINPGNSGGPLVDGEGRVMGINTAIISQTGTDAGIGFAIPASTAVSLAERLIDDGEVSPAFLGIQGDNLEPGAAEQFDLDVASGAVVVAVVPDSPADEAGLAEGDIITGIDGDGVESMFDVQGRIRITEPGTTITLTVVRDGEELELETTLTEQPEQTELP